MVLMTGERRPTENIYSQCIYFHLGTKIELTVYKFLSNPSESVITKLRNHHANYP